MAQKRHYSKMSNYLAYETDVFLELCELDYSIAYSPPISKLMEHELYNTAELKKENAPFPGSAARLRAHFSFPPPPRTSAPAAGWRIYVSAG